MSKFNLEYYKKIKKILYKHKTEKAMNFLREYLDKYPNDYKAITLYSEALLLCNNIENAINVLNTIPESFKHKNIIYAYVKSKLFIYEEKYEEVLKFTSDIDLKNIENELIVTSLKTLIFLAKYKTEKINIETLNPENLTYTNKQILNYSEELAIEHIHKHREEINGNIDIKELFFLVKENLDNKKINLCLTSHDFYIFKYDKIGINKDNTYDNYLKVFVMQNTDNILTMYPVPQEQIEKEHHIIDLNNINLDYKKEKVKRLSQIDKFNRKYKI